MAFSGNTPESLMPRSDSKNPSSTCKGITANGRPCRRSLAASPRSSPAPSPKHAYPGVLAVLSDVNSHHDSAAAFFCWQHKDQATALVSFGGGSTSFLQLKERTSTDELADRLGVLEVEDNSGRKKRRRKISNSDPVRRDTLPKQWQSIPGPLLSVPENNPFGPPPPKPAARPSTQRKKQGDLYFSFFCCMSRSHADLIPPPRPRPSMAQVPPTRPSTSRPPAHVSPRPPTSPHKSRQPHPLQARPYPHPSTSETHALLSLIPPSLAPATTSLLLAELAKPLTQADREPGYVYIFCLAPSTASSPSTIDRDASALLAPPNAPDGRRTTDVLRAFSQDAPGGTARGLARGGGSGQKTLMLKIGRAANVHRRMTQWVAQCGQHVELVRYYPHRPSSPAQSPGSSARSKTRHRTPTLGADGDAGPRKSPLVPRVERLIHLELGNRRVRRECEGCGREHREWFEVEATREGVGAVDEVVRRWVGWGEREGGGG